jgi:hypothetical protein
MAKQKKAGFGKNLNDLIFERAVELAGTSTLSTSDIEVKMRVDQNLVHPMIKVVIKRFMLKRFHLINMPVLK